jgi:hypothetical protein
MLAYSRPSIIRSGSGAGSTNVFDIAGTIPATSSLDLTTIALSSLCSVRFTICVFNSVEDKWCSFEMLAGRQSGSDVEDTVYAKVGDPLDFAVQFLVVGSDAILRITNNESFSLTVDGVRIM